MSYHLEDIESSLIKAIDYDADTRELTVCFRKYYTEHLTYTDVPFNYFEEFASPTGKSHGVFYLEMIKPKFKLKHTYMGDKKSLGVNKASDKKRFIKMRLNVLKFNKEWFFQGEEGVYADITFALMPDGTVDKYGNCGMITQDVPSEVYKANKDIQGEILGNGFEFAPRKPEGAVGAKLETVKKNDIMDDLPF